MVNNNEILLKTFLYDADVSTTIVDAGEWGFHFHASTSSTASESFLRFVPFKRTSGGTETDLFSVTSADINSTSPVLVNTLTTQPAFTVNATDRLGVRVYISTTRNSNTTV